MFKFEQSNSNNSSNQKPAKLWLNVGVEYEGKIITLPLGIPLDSLEVREPNTSNEEYNAFLRCQKQLLSQVREMVESATPGEQKEMTGLKLYARHTADREPAVVTEEVNLNLKLKLK